MAEDDARYAEGVIAGGMCADGLADVGFLAIGHAARLLSALEADS